MTGGSVELEDRLDEDRFLADLAEDVRTGLAASPKELPPKYFYDQWGSELFEKICELPEYYLTRVELSILEARADEIMAICQPTDFVELGPGSGRKTRYLLDAMARRGGLSRYVPVEVSASAVEQLAQELVREYSGLNVYGIVGDFHRHLEAVPPGSGRLVAFLGSTIGNFTRDRAEAFLRELADLVGPAGWFLLGTDLVKDRSLLEAAYNDSAGLTAEFNKNILTVINRHLQADFDPDRFDHAAVYREDLSRIEMRLVAREDHRVVIGDLDLTVQFRAGEWIRTEISCKYTRPTVEELLASAGFSLEHWLTDPEEAFAISLARPVG